MADKVGDVFDGYITGVAPFGMFVELIDHYVEGLVHVSTMADDYYRFREQTHALFGENTKKTYRLGDRVTRADHPRRHGAAADRSRPRGRAREGPARRAARAARSAARARPKKEQRKGTPEERRKTQAARAAKKQRPGAKRAQRRKKRAMTNIVVGTAGHIDHGKSTLVRALTGIDPDRLKEEKARGITIELGLRAHHDRRHARRVRRRARARAVRADDAGRRRRHRLRAADRRGRRIGDAADARALRHLPPAAHSARHRRADQVGSGRCRHARAGPAGRRASSSRDRSSKPRR